MYVYMCYLDIIYSEHFFGFLLVTSIIITHITIPQTRIRAKRKDDMILGWNFRERNLDFIN
jgi:hypothetical protein